MGKELQATKKLLSAEREKAEAERQKAEIAHNRVVKSARMIRTQGMSLTEISELMGIPEEELLSWGLS